MSATALVATLVSLRSQSPERPTIVLPFAKLLTQAADRVYAEPVWLGDRMRAEPLRTMHVFGPLQRFYNTPTERWCTAGTRP